MVKAMRKEKIITIYPTMLKEGLVISHYLPPDPVVIKQTFPSTDSFYLTALMYFESGKKYMTELNVILKASQFYPKKDKMTIQWKHLCSYTLIILLHWLALH